MWQNHARECHVSTTSFALVMLIGMPAFGDELLYDVSFSAPFHTYGAPVTTDLGPTPRQGPSRLNFVDPTVVESFGIFVDGAARFHSERTQVLSQMQFDIEQATHGVGIDAPAYTLDFDIIIDNLGVAADGFTILFDTPTVSTFSFRGDGLIQLGAGATFIGTFKEDEPMHVCVQFFGDEDFWTIEVDGQTLFAGDIVPEFEGLRAIRLSLSDQFALDSVVYVDNVVITAIPTPGCLPVSLLAFVALARRRRGR